MSPLILPYSWVIVFYTTARGDALYREKLTPVNNLQKHGSRPPRWWRDHPTGPDKNKLGDIARNFVCGIVVVTAIAATLPPPSLAQPKLGIAPDLPADGTWTVQRREIPGTRRGHWLVRLTNVQGTLSGVVSLARGSVPLTNLTLTPDGSFSGFTRTGVVGSTYARVYGVSGRFSGDTIHLTHKNDICLARHGVARRR